MLLLFFSKFKNDNFVPFQLNLDDTQTPSL